ncbi:hypothetical protein L1049_004442 [Liquidambar formosana]|uniref:Uncharacterized protein n=1 Tax=Liquidambar formosana TaxID=63359 RepID=A0AAP0RSW9_LIQFO
MGITFSTSISDLLTSCLGFLAKPTQYICGLEGNLDALQSSLEKLSNLKLEIMERINIAVERRQTNSKQLEEIQEWLLNVEVMEAVVNELINDGTREIEKRCLSGCCPRDSSGCSLKNCTSIYKLGKNVVKRMEDLDTLYEQGQRFRVVAERLALTPDDERPSEPTVVMKEDRISDMVSGRPPSKLMDEKPSELFVEPTVGSKQGGLLEVLPSVPLDEPTEPTVDLEEDTIMSFSQDMDDEYIRLIRCLNAPT